MYGEENILCMIMVGLSGTKQISTNT